VVLPGRSCVYGTSEFLASFAVVFLKWTLIGMVEVHGSAGKSLVGR